MMEMRQLKYFLAVAEEGRFARAAQRLCIAAPSLSQQIQALEREMRERLFVRTPQRVDLTPAGQALVRRARVILAEADRARDDVRAAAGGHRDQLSLRVCNMAELVLQRRLRGAAWGIPGAQVSLASSPGDDAVEAVRQGRADAAVVWSRSSEQRDLEGAVLGSVVFGVVLPQGHPLTVVGRVPVAALSGETLMMFPRPPFAGVWDRTVNHLLPEGADRGQIVLEPDLLNAPEAVLRAVAAGTGVAAAPLGIADHMGVGGIEVRALDPALRWDLEIVWRAPVRPAVRSLVEFLGDAVNDPDAVLETPLHWQDDRLSPRAGADNRGPVG
jgi:DNA-binding transcriptional LysR family regulator